MDTQVSFIIILEALGLVLALIAVWSFWANKKMHNDRKIEAALETHLHGVLRADLEVVEKELRKAVQSAGKDAAGILKTNHEKLRTESSELLAEFAQTINTEMTALLREQHEVVTTMFNQKSAEIMHELELYRQQKIIELDSKSDRLLNKLLERKIWRTLQTADHHTIAKQAVQEIIASGELSV